MPSDRHPSRRTVIAGLAASLVSRPAAAAGPRIVSLSYGLAQTLIEIGLPPVGLIDTQDWMTWVVEPALPAAVANIGSGTGPNLEVIARLRPDHIVSTPYLSLFHEALSAIAPVSSYAIHDVGGSPFAPIVAATRALGDLAGRPAAAAALIGRTEANLAAARAAVAPLRDRPALFASFLDPRNIRVYGPGGNLQDVLDSIGLVNGWTAPTNGWGFATVGYEALAAAPDARLFVLDPVPPDVFPTIAGSPLWQSLAFVRRGDIRRLPNTLMFGMLPSMSRYARLLAEAAGEGPRDAS